MLQYWRASASKRGALAWSGLKLVINQTVSASCWPPLSTRMRSSRANCRTWGKPICAGGTAITLMLRHSIRPWPCSTSRSRGGKIVREEVFGLVEQTALVAFDEQEEVSCALLHDGAGRLHLRVEGIHQGNGALQFQAIQQCLARWNLVTLAGHGFHAQGASALGINGPDQLRAPAAPQGFAVQDYHIAIVRSQTSLLPGPDRLLKRQHGHRFEHPVNAVFGGRIVSAGASVEPTAHRRPLGGGQVLREGGHGPMPPLAATEQVGEPDGQHGRLLVTQTIHAAAFGHVPMQYFPEAGQLIAGHLAAQRNLAFIGPERLGQLTVAQLARRVFGHLPKAEL